MFENLKKRILVVFTVFKMSEHSSSSETPSEEYDHKDLDVPKEHALQIIPKEDIVETVRYT